MLIQLTWFLSIDRSKKNVVNIKESYVIFAETKTVYGISTTVGYLTLNLFLYIQTVLFQTIQFSMNIV